MVQSCASVKWSSAELQGAGVQVYLASWGVTVAVAAASATKQGSSMQSVVITGASTGIGWATAKLLLARGFRVFGSVRKQADADRLRGEFGVNFTPLLFDVTDEAAVLAAACEVRMALAGETLTGLVNNAGSRSRGRCSNFPSTTSAARWTSMSSDRSSRRKPSVRCSDPTPR